MILGVAVKFNEVMVCLPKPNRHCHCFWRAKDMLGLAYKLHSGKDNQGFYNEKGEFLTRQEAYWEAERCNQIINPDEKKGILFSENVW